MTSKDYIPSAPTYVSFLDLQEVLDRAFVSNSHLVEGKSWQGMDVSAKPEMVMHELQDVSFKVSMYNGFSQEEVARQLAFDLPGVNLPWAEKHFQERVAGLPMNPGKEWANWPWGHSADKFRDGNGQFNHNYMERYWPRYAGQVKVATHTYDDFDEALNQRSVIGANHGIRYKLGDLTDLVNLIRRDPCTRQAYLPIFFPEDTGGLNGRVPCTLGYHFMMRNNKLHISYYIRSCDYVRHFHDDIYLTHRLAEWVLDTLRDLNPQWKMVSLGNFTMVINSLHCFRNDFPEIEKRVKEDWDR